MVEYPFFFFSIIVGVCLIFITLRPFWETKDLWMNFVDSNPIEYVPIWLFEIKDLSFLNSMKFQRNGSMYIDFEEKISKSSNLSENFLWVYLSHLIPTVYIYSNKSFFFFCVLHLHSCKNPILFIFLCFVNRVFQKRPNILKFSWFIYSMHVYLRTSVVNGEVKTRQQVGLDFRMSKDVMWDNRAKI